MKDRMIAMIGPVLISLITIEVLAAWTRDDGLSSLAGMTRATALTLVAVMLVYSKIAETDEITSVD